MYSAAATVFYRSVTVLSTL